MACLSLLLAYGAPVALFLLQKGRQCAQISEFDLYNPIFFVLWLGIRTRLSGHMMRSWYESAWLPHALLAPWGPWRNWRSQDHVPVPVLFSVRVYSTCQFPGGSERDRLPVVLSYLAAPEALWSLTGPKIAAKLYEIQ